MSSRRMRQTQCTESSWSCYEYKSVYGMQLVVLTQHNLRKIIICQELGSLWIDSPPYWNVRTTNTLVYSNFNDWNTFMTIEL